jgi:transcription elongation factor Elf1
VSPLNAEFECPYCGYSNFSTVDDVAGTQQWTTDCENCCRPIAISAKVRHGEIEELEIDRELD